MSKVLILRCSNPNGTSLHCGVFRWPESGPVECPDWDPKPECGNGLHGWLWGVGDITCISWEGDRLWQVVEVDEADIVRLDGKVKFPRGNVLYSGDRATAVQMVAYRAPEDAPVNWVVRTGGDGCVLVGGHCSTLRGGNYSTLTGGHCSTLTGGYGSNLTGGNYSTLRGGNYSTLRGGDCSTLTGGYGSTLTGGYGSTFKWD